MIYNYLKISLRKIKRNKLFSFINVFGLSFSLSICLIIIMLLADQYSYDDYNTDSSHIYRINHTRSDMDAIIKGMATSPMPLAEELASNYPGVSAYSRFYRGFGNDWIKLMQDVNIPVSGYYADPAALTMFKFELEYGNPSTALLEPYSVVITKETAEKLFNKQNPLGEAIEVGELGSYKVTGVMKKMRGKSHIKFDALASMSSLSSLAKMDVVNDNIESWRNQSGGWTYIKLEEGKSIAEIESGLAQISEDQYGEMDDMDAGFYLQNIRDINPGPFIGNQIGPGLPMIFVYFLFGIAMVIIISSCFNYTNMSLARSLGRAREVGIRKVFGAYRHQIFFQFLTESIVVSILAFIFCLGILFFLKPVFLQLNFSQLLDMDLDQSLQIYVLCFGFAIIMGIVAGIIPAIFHSSVQALQGLKKLSGVKVFSRIRIRNVLIVAQFGLSIFLVITVCLINNQMNYMIEKEYGFDADNIVVVKLNNSDPDRLKNELLKYPTLMSVSAAGFVPAAGTSSSMTLLVNNEKQSINYFEVDEDYIDNMGLTLVAGSKFSKERLAEKLIINEQAVDMLQYASPLDAIGEVVTTSDTTDYEIIGVVEDYNHETLFSKIKPLAFVYRPEEFGVMQVRINSNNYDQAITDIHEAWTEINPFLKIEYKLLSEEIAFFADMMFGDLTKIISFVSLLAILIACLGLMGMVIFSTQTRMKEVSIRKVLGASTERVLYILSSGFFKLLGVSILLGIPIAWYVNNLWLNFIAYRVDIGIGVILFAILTVGFLGTVVVGSQTWQAANADPAKVLRDE